MRHSPTTELFSELDHAISQHELPAEYRPLIYQELREQIARGEQPDASKAVRIVKRAFEPSKDSRNAPPEFQ